MNICADFSLHLPSYIKQVLLCPILFLTKTSLRLGVAIVYYVVPLAKEGFPVCKGKW